MQIEVIDVDAEEDDCPNCTDDILCQFHEGFCEGWDTCASFLTRSFYLAWGDET